MIRAPITSDEAKLPIMLTLDDARRLERILREHPKAYWKDKVAAGVFSAAIREALAPEIDRALDDIIGHLDRMARQ